MEAVIRVERELAVGYEVRVEELRLLVDEDEVDPRFVDSVRAAPRPTAGFFLREEGVGEAEPVRRSKLDEAFTLGVPVATSEGSQAGLLCLTASDSRIEVSEKCPMSETAAS